MYQKGLEHLEKYPFLKKLSHREIKARALDLNYTIQATNNFLLGVYNPINKGPELPFDINDPRTFPPEPLSFNPKDVIDFKTALPYGLQFIPVLSSSSKDDLKFMLVDQTCPKWTSVSQDRLYRANERLQKNSYFQNCLEKVEKFMGLDDLETFSAQTNRSVIEKCFRLKLGYQDLLEKDGTHEKHNSEQLSEELKRFLDNCEAYYWLLKLDDHHYSKLQATPFYDKIKAYVKTTKDVKMKL